MRKVGNIASIVKKTLRGKPYDYARECQCIDGRPPIVWQKYLGKANAIIAALTQPPETGKPQSAVGTEFGAIAALYDLAERLGLAKIIDTPIPKRGSGPLVGTYLWVAVLNRCVAPCSKAGIATWFQDTALRRLDRDRSPPALKPTLLGRDEPDPEFGNRGH